jgi:acyl-CoA hydrolase
MKTSDPAILQSLFSPGMKVFVPGSASEPVDALRWLESDLARSEGIELTTTLIAGVNRLDLSRLHPSARLVGNFTQADFRQPQREGRYRHLPITYAGLARYVRETYEPDVAFCHVSRPDADGQVSMGLSVEMTALCLGKARRKVAVVNPNMPFVPKSVSFPLSGFDHVLVSETPLATYDNGPPSDDAVAIAGHLSALIGDGATLQTGLGKVPDAMLRALLDRRGLRLHSGIISDGVVALANAGALDPGHPHVTCGILGTVALYDWAGRQDLLAVRGCDYTHDPARVAGIERLVAINSALAVDLFGQCDLETAGGRIISSFGGAPDFARGARNSRGGISVIAVPATYRASGGAASRIIARLGPDNLVSIPRNDVDVVATEFGLADLRGKSLYERAEALIEVAAPQFRAELRDQWNEISARI